MDAESKAATGDAGFPFQESARTVREGSTLADLLRRFGSPDLDLPLGRERTQGRQCLWCREDSILAVRIENAVVKAVDFQDCRTPSDRNPSSPPSFFAAGKKLEKGLPAAAVLGRMGKPVAVRTCAMDDCSRTLLSYEERGYRCEVWLTDGLFDVAFTHTPDALFETYDGVKPI